MNAYKTADGNPLAEVNTLCPKLGAAQWTCSASECTCHLKAAAQLRQMNEDVRRVAMGLEPLEVGEWSSFVCPEGHMTKKCSEPDNVYCPTCDTYYDPRP